MRPAGHLLVDDRDRMRVRQLLGRQREGELAERRHCTGAVGHEFADGVVVIAVRIGPAGVDVLLLLFLVSHAHIVAGAATGGEVGQLLYAGQQ